MGVIGLATTYFFFVVLMPYACLLLQVLLLFFPMNIRNQKFWLISVEITNAWSSLDVFLLAILTAVFQISKFASFIIGTNCEGINEVLKQNFDEMLKGNDICYDMNAGLLPQSVFLIFGVSFYWIICCFTLKYGRLIVFEHYHESRSENDKESLLSFTPINDDMDFDDVDKDFMKDVDVEK